MNAACEHSAATHIWRGEPEFWVFPTVGWTLAVSLRDGAWSAVARRPNSCATTRVRPPAGNTQ